ncbi:MAG: hypothetical protein JWR69_252 [Pedosphaera sp.]|nr:hypothetical protein [Pedosphaera sp.]
MFWTGHIMSTLPALLLIFSAVMKFMKPAAVVEGFTHFGLPERLLFGLGVVELVCTLLYLIPRTAVLGAILLTGYLGGATLANLRVGEPYLMTVILGIVLWGGLFLRDRRVRALIPLR